LRQKGTIVRGLPWWFAFAVVVVRFWFVSVPLIGALALAAWYGAPWLGALRWILLAAVVVLALPFPAAAAVFFYQRHDATRFWRTLNAAESFAGVTVPAGSKIRFADKKHTIPVSIMLPHVTEIDGMRLTGELRPWGKWRGVEGVWGGDLAEDQRLGGLPCRAGPYQNDRFGGILFDDARVIHRCTLAAEHALLGLKLPPGTTVSRGNDSEPWRFLLPADSGMDIPVLATHAPPGVTLSVANDGTLLRIGSGHGQTIVVRGVPLNSLHFELHGDTVVSELAEPFSVAGETRPAGAPVTIDLATGGVSAFPRGSDC
jgi:hypothetical protein